MGSGTHRATVNLFSITRSARCEFARSFFALFALAVISAGSCFAQTPSLHGTITDPTGAVVPNANVTITDSSGTIRSAVSDKNGSYSFVGLSPGSYTLQVSAPDLALPEPMPVTLSGRAQTMNLTLKVQVAKHNVNVEEPTGPAVSAENSRATRTHTAMRRCG